MRCKGCQFFAKQQHLPAQALRTIPPSWPFAMLGLDSVRSFRTAPSGYKHILVAVDKFTKWIEVRPVAKHQKKWQSSSETLHIASVCPIGSSPTWAKLSLAPPFGIFTKKTLSTSTTPRSPTLSVTARSNVPMTWSFRPSKTASTMTPPIMPPGG
jgi:hypothetical protein